MTNIEDQDSAQKKSYLLSIPNIRKSIIEGIKIPLKECNDKIDW